MSAAQGFYHRGLRLCQRGDPDAARQLWENVVRTFRDVDSERRWVQLAEDGLHGLAKQTSTSKHPDESVQRALRQARQWRDQGQPQKAEAIWRGLEALYRDDPSGTEVLREVERARRP